jgi:uncharacterized protein with HEPN domain
LKKYLSYLKHILIEIDFIIDNSKDLKYEKFIKDEILKRAFVRSIEIIGEAVKNLPDSFKTENTGIEWKEIAGMRDRLIHHYFSIDLEIVWDVVQNELPVLKETIEKMINEIKE